MATVRKVLVVEVVEARNLSPKDGHGTSSPYVVADYYGQRKRTKTAIQDLNPVWNELLEFNVVKPSDVFGDVLELNVYHDKNVGPTRRNNFLGRIRFSSTQFVKKGEEVLLHFPLEKRTIFGLIQGDIGLKIYYVDEVVPPSAPPSPPSPPPQAPETKAETALPPPPSEAAPPPAEPAEEAKKADPPAETPPAAEQTPTEEPPAEAPPPETVATEAQESDSPPPTDDQQVGPPPATSSCRSN